MLDHMFLQNKSQKKSLISLTFSDRNRMPKTLNNWRKEKYKIHFTIEKNPSIRTEFRQGLRGCIFKATLFCHLCCCCLAFVFVLFGVCLYVFTLRYNPKSSVWHLLVRWPGWIWWWTNPETAHPCWWCITFSHCQSANFAIPKEKPN